MRPGPATSGSNTPRPLVADLDDGGLLDELVAIATERIRLGLERLGIDPATLTRDEIVAIGEQAGRDVVNEAHALALAEYSPVLQTVH